MFNIFGYNLKEVHKQFSISTPSLTPTPRLKMVSCCFLDSCYSKCGPGTSEISIT